GRRARRLRRIQRHLELLPLHHRWPVLSHRRGEPECEYAPVADRALDRDAALLELGEQSRDSETESGAAQFTAPRLIDPEKSVKDQLLMLRCDPWSGVVNRHADHVSVLLDTETDLTLERVPYRVGRQIQEDVARAVGISHGPRAFPRLGAHREPLVGRHGLRDLSDLVDDGSEIERNARECQLSVLATGDE